MIRSIHKIVTLITPLQFYSSQARRNPLIPTQASFLKPFDISNLNDNLGSAKTTKRLGRGPGSGKGKTSGKGHKGHNARAGGGVHPRFEGGQTPLQIRIPKYGKGKKIVYVPPFSQVNMHQIDYFVRRGIINPAQKITIKVLSDVGLVKKVKTGVKVLGKGVEYLDYPISLEVNDASKTVINKIQEVGGSIQLVHRTPLKLREHVFPEKYPLPLREPITPAYMMRKLERKIKDRGIPIKYKKPKWKLQEEASGKVAKKPLFVYPVPRVNDPNKIRKRRPQLFRKISLNL